MKKMRLYRAADWGPAPESVTNWDRKQLFKRVDLKWTTPVSINKTGEIPLFSKNVPILYVLVRDHGKFRRTNNILYVGLSKSPRTRFYGHGAVKALAKMAGVLTFSYAVLSIKGRNREVRETKSLNEIEHIFIWALWAFDHDLHNVKKQNTLPGLGKSGGSAWHICNTGERFGGRMPREIVYPWMLVRLGRDRSERQRKTA